MTENARYSFNFIYSTVSLLAAWCLLCIQFPQNNSTENIIVIECTWGWYIFSAYMLNNWIKFIYIIYFNRSCSTDTSEMLGYRFFGPAPRCAYMEAGGGLYLVSHSSHIFRRLCRLWRNFRLLFAFLQIGSMSGFDGRTDILLSPWPGCTVPTPWVSSALDIMVSVLTADWAYWSSSVTATLAVDIWRHGRRRRGASCWCDMEGWHNFYLCCSPQVAVNWL